MSEIAGRNFQILRPEAFPRTVDDPRVIESHNSIANARKAVRMYR